MKNINFYADDYGYTSKVNREISRLFENGKISGFAVLSDFVDKKSAAYLKNKPVILHINLVEGKKYSPLPLFVLKLLLGLSDFGALKKDVQRQIDVLKNHGANVIGLNTHQHTGALYPVSEMLFEIAEENNIKLSVAYKNLAAQTVLAKLCLILLKLTSCLSYFRYTLKIGLPKIWEISGNPTYFMSWEGKNFSMDKLPDKNVDLIIHPGTKFDKNKKFDKYL